MKKTKRSKPLISLCMIVKNEEEILEKCLDHVKGIVDEFVIVDTGSTDGTKEIIGRYGKVHELPFENFVTTKNKALELATGDYILWMDADEILYAGAEILRIHAQEGQYDAIIAKITEGPAEDYNAIACQYDRARLWRRGAYSFVGPGVHEVAVGEGRNVLDRRVLVRHEHLKKNKNLQMEAIKPRYVEWLTAAIAANPRDGRAWFYLARTYRDMDRGLEAIDAYRSYLDIHDNPFRDERWQACYDIARIYQGQGEYSHAETWARKAQEIDPRRSEVDCLLGDIAFLRQDYGEAFHNYQQALREIPGDVSLFLNPQLYDAFPRDQMMLCLYYNGQFSDALRLNSELVAKTAGRDNRILNNQWWCTVKQRPNVFLTLGNTPEPIFGGILKTQGVHGVETTYIELAAELARCGMNVYLFCTTAEAHEYEGVYYIPYQDIDHYWGISPDILISSRWFDPFFREDKSKKIIWYQDAFFAMPGHLGDVYGRTDAVICSSLWHRDYILNRMGRAVDGSKLQIIPLGIRKNLFTQPIIKDPHKVLYSSNPDRGLEHLLDYWPRIVEAVPDVHLDVLYGWEGLKTWSADAAWQQNITAFQKKCLETADRFKNIRFLGRVTKEVVAREMLAASILAYPNNFWETFCLTALEAQAAGAVVVTTDMGALSTVVARDCNFLIPGSPRSDRYQASFVEAVVSLLQDREQCVALSWKNRARVSMMPCDWQDVAELWVKKISSLLK